MRICHFDQIQIQKVIFPVLLPYELFWKGSMEADFLQAF